MYYPKSQIKTNLHTNGNELYFFNNGEPYTGYYYEISTGKKYTGKDPNFGIGILLIDTPPLGLTTEDYEGESPQILKSSYVKNYNNTPITSRSLPSPYYSFPTPEEKEIGEYRRYFTKKTNELIYIEISKETYDKFKSNDPTVASDLYECLFLPWSLPTLETNEISSETTNQNVVSLIERDNKWYGFSFYFQGNFG